MAVAPTIPVSPPRPARPPADFWRVPLVPVAWAFTAGIVLDRLALIPLPLSLVVAFACLIAWALHRSETSRLLGLFYLVLVIVASGAAYHAYHNLVPADDVSRVAAPEGGPRRVRGVVQSGPTVQAAGPADPLLGRPASAATHFVVRVTRYQAGGPAVWVPVTGQVQVSAAGLRPDFTVGDELELLGRLALPDGPANPGGLDWAAFLRDQQITATLAVPEGGEVRVVRTGWPRSLFGWLAVVREWGGRTLSEALPQQQGLATALLLGDGSGLGAAEWDVYQRTGVVHVLAISGQHLVVAAGFLMLFARPLRLGRRPRAALVGLVLVGYALLAGGRPPVMRAAWMVGAGALAVILGRPAVPGNLFALGWLGVAVLNPADVFNTGCQLSFLAVAVLMWGTNRWRPEPDDDPLARVIEESRPWAWRMLSPALRAIGYAYLANLAVWLAVTPLVAARFHLVSPVALLLGPPAALFSSAALIGGFMVLLVAPWGGPLAWPCIAFTRVNLAGCEELVRWGAELPGAYFYVSDVPTCWLFTYYFGLLFVLPLSRQHLRLCWFLTAMCLWLAPGAALVFWPHHPGEFRCSFLAVGHGGCTVVETPGGRVLLYDAGAMAGPDVTRRHIAPFLWGRGILSVDEVFISHADLDHFNGLPELAGRFRVGRVTTTPTFAGRDLAAVAQTSRALDARYVPLEVVSDPRSWEQDGVRFEVLHPPAVGPDGNENARSLVLLVTYRDLRVLLTGDLEGPGLERVLQTVPPRVDVLMAPHHGSEKSDPARLAAWARPRVVVSCAGPPRFVLRTAAHYERAGADFLTTWSHGTVTVRHDGRSARVETFRTEYRRPLP